MGRSYRDRVQGHMYYSNLGTLRDGPLVTPSHSLTRLRGSAACCDHPGAHHPLRHSCVNPTAPQPSADAEWAFMRLGYSECFDAFFTFALFAIARDSGFFPPVLVEKFEPVMQEEARHILFFVNWEAYRQARSPLWQRPRQVWRGALGRVLQVWRRVQTAIGARGDKDFTMKGHQAINMDITLRGFLELCLVENARRLERYDARLLRPRLVPGIVKTLC